MRTIQNIFALFLCISVPAAYAAETGNVYKIQYDGGSIPEIKAGVGLKLFIEAKQIRLVKDKADVTVIPISSVTEVSYGQDVHRRVGAAIGIGVFTLGLGALMLLAKSKKHFVGITWADGEKKGGIAFQAEKGDYRGLLAGLEGVTGKKAVDSDALTVKN
jgi:hypothetical protein